MFSLVLFHGETNNLLHCCPMPRCWFGYLQKSLLQVPKDKEELEALKLRLRKKFPVDAFNKARTELDPNHILSNNMLDKLFS